MINLFRKRKISKHSYQLEVDGRNIPLTVRKNSRARRMILRLDTGSDGAVVTIPAHADPADGLEMARRQSAWLSERLEALPQRLTFAEGSRIPYLGREHTLHRTPDRRGVIKRTEGEIFVPGAPEHMARRLTDWFRKQARTEISGRAHAKAALIGQTPGRITIRDTRSRWGSCASGGGLSFSWRLIMAPEDVLDYVVAHEVSHLAHMNHGPRFWKTVAKLVDDVDGSREWLRVNGEQLHRIG